jgi:hypothetical protein
MLPEENKKLVLDHYESFVNQQDAEAVRRQLAPDFRDHEIPPGVPVGPEGALEFRAMLHAAFPDLRIIIEDIVAERRPGCRARQVDGHPPRAPAHDSGSGQQSPLLVHRDGVLARARPPDCGALGKHRPSGTDSTAYPGLVSRNRRAA